MKLTYNEYGGVKYDSRDEIARGQRVDLLTMPPNIHGTNCGNCRFIESTADAHKSYSFCNHPDIQLDVNDRMCCALWDHSKAIRQYAEDVN